MADRISDFSNKIYILNLNKENNYGLEENQVKNLGTAGGYFTQPEGSSYFNYPYFCQKERGVITYSRLVTKKDSSMYHLTDKNSFLGMIKSDDVDTVSFNVRIKWPENSSYMTDSKNSNVCGKFYIELGPPNVLLSIRMLAS